MAWLLITPKRTVSFTPIEWSADFDEHRSPPRTLQRDLGFVYDPGGEIRNLAVSAIFNMRLKLRMIEDGERAALALEAFSDREPIVIALTDDGYDFVGRFIPTEVEYAAAAHFNLVGADRFMGMRNDREYLVRLETVDELWRPKFF